MSKFHLDSSALICRVCGNTGDQRKTFNEISLQGTQKLYRCGCCAACYLHPDLTDASLTEFYSVHYRHLYPIEAAHRYDENFFTLRMMRRFADLRVERFEKIIKQGGRILEIGSGFGSFISALKSRRQDVTCIAIELDKAHREADLKGNCIQFAESLEEATLLGPYDAIFMFHVLEHLKYPVEMLSELHALLSSNGKIIIEVPDIMSEWKQWQYHVHPAHITYFSKHSLGRLLIRCGYDLEVSEEHPDSLRFGGTLLAIANNTNTIQQPDDADADEIQALDSHIDHYRPGLKNRIHLTIKTIIVTLLGPENVGAIQRTIFYRRNKGMIGELQ